MGRIKKISGEVGNFLKKIAEKIKNIPKKAKVIIIVVAAVIAAAAVVCIILLSQTLGRMNRIEDNQPSEVLMTIKKPCVILLEEAQAEKEREDMAAEQAEAQRRAQEEAEAEIRKKLEGVDIDVMREDYVKNILLIGQDKRSYEDEPQRSDSMIIASINTRTNKITLCSLMRDMYVSIPGSKDNRINEAYQYGGMELLDQTIEENLGVHIDGNVEVDFEGFKEIFSVIGDIEIDIKDYEVNHLNKIDDSWNITEGVNMLNGEQALAYARTRKVGNSDWERTDRQRRVLSAAFDKVKDLDVFSMISLASKISPYITTDINTKEFLGYAYIVATNHMSLGENYRFPAEGHYSCQTLRKGMEVLVPDLEANAQLLKECLYGEGSGL